MNRSQSQQAYAQTVGTTPTGSPIVDSRDPTEYDIYYLVGQFWINQPLNKVWYLNSLSNQVTSTNLSGNVLADWELIFSLNFANQYVTDDGTAIPVANVLNVLGGPGIETYADPDNSNNLYISLGNGCDDTTTTVDAAVSNITCIDLGTIPGTFTFTTTVAAYATSNTGPSTNLSAGYVISGVVRATGAAGILVGTPDKLVFEEGALTAGNCQCGVSGNNLIITCTGTAGYDIDWREVTSAVFHS